MSLCDSLPFVVMSSTCYLIWLPRTSFKFNSSPFLPPRHQTLPYSNPLNLTRCVSLSLTACVFPQTQRAEHLLRDRGYRAPEVGPGPVSLGSVDHLLLLHLEGSQVHRESECRPPSSPPDKHILYILCCPEAIWPSLFFFLPPAIWWQNAVAERKAGCSRGR